MKFCKDCRWAFHKHHDYTPVALSLRGYDWECRHPSSARPGAPPNIVTGETSPPEQWSCPEARSRIATNLCGAEGRYWEAKEAGPSLPLSGRVDFGDALKVEEPRRWPDDIEDAFAGDEGMFEWTRLSTRMTGLPFDIRVCDIKPIIAVTEERHIARDELARLYRWLKLNADALATAQSGEIDTAQLVERLRRLP